MPAGENPIEKAREILTISKVLDEGKTYPTWSSEEYIRFRLRTLAEGFRCAVIQKHNPDSSPTDINAATTLADDILKALAIVLKHGSFPVNLTALFLFMDFAEELEGEELSSNPRLEEELRVPLKHAWKLCLYKYYENQSRVGLEILTRLFRYNRGLLKAGSRLQESLQAELQAELQVKLQVAIKKEKHNLIRLLAYAGAREEENQFLEISSFCLFLDSFSPRENFQAQQSHFTMADRMVGLA